MAIVPRSDITGKAPEARAGLSLPPGLIGYNVEPQLGLRRVTQLDNTNRVATQIAVDRGTYSRPPIPPVEYGEGNIKKSTQLTGAPGYNQRNIPLPESPDDMSQAQYMASLIEANPANRMSLRRETGPAQQNFVRTPLATSDYPLLTHNMMNNLLALAKQKMSKIK